MTESLAQCRTERIDMFGNPSLNCVFNFAQHNTDDQNALHMVGPTGTTSRPHLMSLLPLQSYLQIKTFSEMMQSVSCVLLDQANL